MIKFDRKKIKSLLFIAVPVLILVIILLLPSDSPTNQIQNPLPSFTKDTGKSFVGQGGGNVGSQNLDGINTIADEGVYESYTPPESSVAQQTKLKALPHLPIYVEGFETSVGITTDINIFTVPGDLSDTLRLEIYNINYQNQDVEQPHAVAFRESFIQAKEELRKIDVDPAKVNFIFGTRNHIQKTANYWVTTFSLL